MNTWPISYLDTEGVTLDGVLIETEWRHILDPGPTLHGFQV